MKHIRRILLVVAGMAAVAGLWAWGDRQAQELAEWKKVWGMVFEAAYGGIAEGEVSVETMGRFVLKELETARKGGAEVKASAEELEAARAGEAARAEKAEAEFAELSATLEKRVAEVRKKYEKALEECRAEAAAAKEEREAAVKGLAAVETRLADVEATLEAVINVPGDAVELGEEAGAGGEDPEAGSEEKGAAVEAEEGGLPGAQLLGEGEEGPAEEETEEAVVPEETVVPEEAVVAGRVVGASRLFLTLAYAAEGGVLTVQFQNGEELAYKGVPPEVASAVRESGDGVDGAVRRRVKGKYEVEGDEEGTWKAMGKWNKKRKGKGEEKARVEAVWVGEE